MSQRPFNAFIVLIGLVFFVAVYMTVAPAILGPLGSMAKDSAGSNGEGFSVSDGVIDSSAKIAILHIPSLMLGIVGVWAMLALLILLAYAGVI